MLEQQGTSDRSYLKRKARQVKEHARNNLSIISPHPYPLPDGIGIYTSYMRKFCAVSCKAASSSGE
jgi:hypothetical protein